MGRSSKKRNIGLWIVGILTAAVIGISVWQIVKLVAADSRGTAPETSLPQSSESRPGEENQGNTGTAGTEATEQAPPAELALPCDLFDGVELDSLFRYTGPNPDCGDESGDQIGAIILNNRSGKHLSELTIAVELSNGETLPFCVKDLPDGQTVWAFTTGNEKFPDDAYPVSVTKDLQFSQGPAIPEGVTWEADYTEVTLTNNSGKDLTDLTVVCRCMLEDAFYGGMVYEYTLDSLPDGESAVISAEDCYLGDAVVVCVKAGK